MWFKENSLEERKGDRMTHHLILQQMHQELNISIKQIETTLELLQQGSTIPFIARYRKEVTGGLDEVEIHTIEQRFDYLTNLSQRKEEIVRLIDEQDKLTPELQQQIEQATTLQQVEDLYRPYKQKKRTKAMIAIEQGLQPFAEWIMTNTDATPLEEEAVRYLNEEVIEVQSALQGAHEIIAQLVSDDANFRSFIRKYSRYNASIVTQEKDTSLDDKQVYQMYYEMNEPFSKVKAHNILAMNRAEKEGVISIKLTVDEQPIYRYIQQRFITNTLPNEQIEFIEKAIQDAYKRFIAPAIERELRNEATEVADQQAIAVFGENLKNLLLTAPLKGKVVMGFDPAYRTGCKLAIINPTGAVLAKSVIYPHESSKGKDSQEKRQARWSKAQAILIELIETYGVELIAIGNGTASRESEFFVSDTIKQLKQPVHYLVVSEAGASVYSASEIAREEFPDWEASQRSAVSIARRVQDPLAELIKIDPKSLGVGQYQHDVSQKALTQQLDFVVNTTVNQVGVDINTASPALLQHVSGLTKATAANIIALRDAIGTFTSREQVKDVKRLGPKTYEQAIGFLRVMGGDNPLDQTNIHPESYDIAERILSLANVELKSIGSQEANEKLQKLTVDFICQELSIGKSTAEDILSGLKNPTADIRDGQATPTLHQDVLTIEDLSVGMVLEGVVRNVVDFGAFVDIGVKQDGLIHISKMGKKRQRQIHPSEIVSVGQIVDVEVISVELDKQRIGLKLKEIHS